MKIRERTMQQLDPLGSAGSRDSAVIITLTTWTYVALVTVIEIADKANPLYLALAFGLFTAACVVNLIASTPRNAPYSRATFSLMLFLALSGAAFQLAAVHGADFHLSNDWGPLAVALLLASASVFRPRRDQYFAGISSIIVIGTILAIEATVIEPPFGPAYLVLAGVSPIIIIVSGQASYTGKATRTMVTWLKNSRKSSATADPGLMTSVGRQLAQEFRSEVEPLFLGILQSDSVNPTDVETARSMASHVRSRLIELSNQSWLARTGAVVEDEEGLTSKFDESSRTALIALVQGLGQLDNSDITVQLSRDSKNRISVELTSSIARDGLRLRNHLAPFLRVMYVVFEDVRVSYQPDKVLLKFHYGVD